MGSSIIVFVLQPGLLAPRAPDKASVSGWLPAAFLRFEQDSRIVFASSLLMETDKQVKTRSEQRSEKPVFYRKRYDSKPVLHLW